MRNFYCSFAKLPYRDLFDYFNIRILLLSKKNSTSYLNSYAKERIRADSAEPKSIAYLRKHGLRNIRGAKKGADSIRAGISLIQDYKIIIHPRCVNFLTEINSYTWDVDKFDNRINRPIDDFNHLMDAMRYAMEEFDGRKGVRLMTY